MFDKRPLTKDEDLDWLGIRWQPTMRCNFNCFFCLQHQYKHHNDEIEKAILNESLDKIDKAFASGKLKWWKIIGGEFTILPLSIRDRVLDIAKKYAAAKRYDLFFRLSLNYDMKRAMKRNMRSPGLYARLASGMYLLSPGGFYFLIGQMDQHRHHERRANGFTS